MNGFKVCGGCGEVTVNEGWTEYYPNIGLISVICVPKMSERVEVPPSHLARIAILTTHALV